MTFDKTETSIFACAGVTILAACILIPLKDSTSLSDALGSGFVAACVLALGLLIYFAPAIVARKKRNFAAIFFLNFLLGWTLVGWAAAMTWALTKDTDR